MHSLVTIYLDEHGHCFDANKGMQWMEKIADGGNAAMMVKYADLSKTPAEYSHLYRW